MSSQLQLVTLSFKRSPHTIKQIDKILTQTITSGLLHTTSTLNYILTVYSKSPTPIKAILLYNHSIKNSIPLNKYSYPVLFKACTRLKSLPKGKEVHAHVTKVGLDGDVYVQNALIHFYGSTGQIGDARYVFDKMPQRDLASWNSLLAAYNLHFVYGVETLVLFKQMICEGIGADSITFVIIISALAELREAEYGSSIHGSVIKNGFHCYLNLENAMLDMYVKYGNMNAALTLFTEMGGRRDVVSHTILINGYVKTGFVDLARDIFDRMLDKDLVLWNSMIRGYVESNRPNEALALFEKMENVKVKPDESTVDVVVGTALIDMYSKCGSIVDAMSTFYKMEDKDVFTWTTAIGGLANFGYVKESLNLFNQMENEGVNPNEATFVYVLTACRQAGLVKEGCFLFTRLVRDYKIQPKVEHFGCLIDLLSRAGQLHQAEDFIKTMDPGERLVAYKTLLSACMNYSKIDLGLKVADELYRLASEDHAVRVLLSNFYALAGEWSKVEEIRQNMKISRMLKEPGISSLGMTA
ncbi:hypothetical protein Vadar_010313 [Vaccinium darrowii]|uniref:Uncharacterized protein n=1 Tax=Vaccinium darrowii TaxID=229202 RepID=A0ACB7XGI4_9ERIC|nr:hypothetical protein Vadar_010313 [Vaccinium darrowii]